MDGLISVVIPARNEPYLFQTINDLLSKSSNIEVIVVLDGYWPDSKDIINDKRVVYLNFSQARGMRNAINSAVSISHGEFILKTDAHCMFDKDFDTKLKENCEYDWVVVPRRYALDPIKWEIEKRKDNKYPVDYMFLNKELHGEVWTEKNLDPALKEKKIDDLMSSQGSCWFMKRSYFDWLGLMDVENWGQFANEFQEIGFKSWLSGGKVKVNKNTWYAHWHKTKGRGYSLNRDDAKKGADHAQKWLKGKMWYKQRHDFNWMIEKFNYVAK